MTYANRLFMGVKKYATLPLTILLDTNPRENFQVDMIGPWKVQFELTNEGNKISRHIKALMVVDRATSWPEFAVAKNFTSAHVSQLFDREWLCRYPRPTMVIHGNGNKFNGLEIQELL